MFRYYDKDGNLICQAETIEEMVEKSGLTQKQIDQRVRSWRHRKKNPIIRKPACPYMECDDDHYAAKDDLGQRFLQLHFEGKTSAEIQAALNIRDSQMRYLYGSLLGIDPPRDNAPKADNDLQKGLFREGFWEEWDEARMRLINSGANLKIPITSYK